jgi:Tol biopolymer transport system component
VRAIACVTAVAIGAVGASPAWATFPGRNGRIVFELVKNNGADRDRPCTTPSCYERVLGAVDPRTGRKLRFNPCTNPIECNDVTPSFSPDGSRIAFGRYEYSQPPPPETSASPDRFQVAVTGVSGRSVDVLAEPAFDPAWSPNGRWLAVARSDSIQLIHPDGARGRRTLDLSGGSLDWSSSGRLAIVRSVGRRPDIYTVNPDGSGLKRVTAGGNAHDPSWAPDGRSLAFTHVVRDSRDRIVLIEVVAIGPNGHRRVLVRHAQNPVWSPDGKQLAFARLTGIWVMRLRDRATRRLLGVGEHDGYASLTWRPLR